MRHAKTTVVPEPPAGLSRPACDLWHIILDGWELESHHLAILEQACRALTRINEAEARILADGLFIEDRFGQKREHPAAAVEATNRRLFKSFLRELQLDTALPDAGYDRAPRLAPGDSPKLKRA